MISLLLFLFTILLSMSVTKIGTIALEITGLHQEQASFQAMSAYSGVGFTTREAEFAVNHPQRRKIIKTLIRLGSAGIITTMATMVGTVVSSPKILHSVVDDTYFAGLPFNQTQLVLALLVIIAFSVQHILSKPAVSRLIKEFVTQILLQEHLVESVQYEEVLSLSNGYGLVQVEVCEKNPLMGKQLKEARLEEKGITILSVERLTESILSPTPELRIEVGDRLLCFGPLINTTISCCVPTGASHPMSKAEQEDAPLPLHTLAPDFALPDQFGRTVRLADYRGKRNIILLFYPKDKSFTCSAQLGKFGRHLKELDALETDIFAINQESVQSHAAFGEQLHVNFSILSDPRKQICKAYKALMFGGLLVNRTVYVIDKDGMIRYAKRGNPSIFEVVGALQPGSAFPQEPVALGPEVCQLI